jgi:hypothetical protein
MLSGEWCGVSIAVISAPDGPCAGLDASAAETLSPGAETAWWDAAAQGLRQAAPALAQLTLAVPEAWLDAGTTGAARLESAWAAFTRQGWPGFEVVSRPVAMLAQYVRDAPQAAGRCIVIFLGTGQVRATVCHVTESAVRAVATSAAPLPAPPQPVPPQPGGLAAAAFSAAASPQSAVHRHAVRHGRQRLLVALAAANRSPSFLEVPVLGPAGTPPQQWLTARQLRDLLAGWSQAIGSVVHAVADAAHDGAGAARGPVTVLVTGPGRDDLLAQEEIADAVAESVPGPRPVPAVPSASAVAEGAALVAAGQLTTASTPAQDFALPVHRIVSGQAVSQSVRLPSAPAPGPVVQVAADEVTGPVLVDAWVPRGTARLTVHAAESIPAGRYRASVWPGWGEATLVLRPERGGEAMLFTLPLDEARDGGRRPSTAESERAQ